MCSGGCGGGKVKDYSEKGMTREQRILTGIKQRKSLITDPNLIVEFFEAPEIEENGNP